MNQMIYLLKIKLIISNKGIVTQDNLKEVIMNKVIENNFLKKKKKLKKYYNQFIF
jgi:hypothetical protein